MIQKTLIAYLLTLSTCYAGTIDPDVSDKNYIEYGQKFPNVIQVMTLTDGNIEMGSAVVIKPHWIITSAHIVDGKKLIAFIINEKRMAIGKNKIVHKGFRRPYTKSDIALVRVDTPIEMNKYPELYSDNDELNKEYSVSGYGVTGNFKTGAQSQDGKKRAGKNKISSISEDLLIAEIVEDKRCTNLDYGIASGDSGGGMFIDDKLAGINCCILASDKKADADYGDESGFLRISEYRDWIIENIEE